MSFIRPVLTALANFQQQHPSNKSAEVPETARECTVALEKIFKVVPNQGENLLARAGRVVQISCRKATDEEGIANDKTLLKCINIQSRLKSQLDVPPEDFGFFPSAIDAEILGLRLLNH